MSHPLAASGARITAHLLHSLRATGQRYGLGTACIGGGQGIAIVVDASADRRHWRIDASCDGCATAQCTYAPRFLLAVFACCATSAPAIAQQTSRPARTDPHTDASIIPESQTRTWPVKTREQVDLWLHGFTLLDEDSSAVPLFHQGYRDAVTVAKNKINLLTQLDVNIDRLRERGKTNRLLTSAQFIPFYFSSTTEMRTTIDHFLATNGDPTSVGSRTEGMQFAVLGSYFQTAADRMWLSLFANCLWDEQAKFFHAYWVQQQRARANVIDSVQALWQFTVRPRLQRFLNNTQQRNGDILLSLPIGAEGRTITSSGTIPTTISVFFPERPSDALQAIYVIVHEIVSAATTAAITDHVTPTEQRNGIPADRLSTIASVRGGLILMEKFLPEFADGYARYYIQSAGRTPHDNPRAQLAALFPLPDAIRDAIVQQIDVISCGI